ncbi:MAG: class C sortase [Clostridia bacterium]|nr:class C sortase [Clostridia bacterium]
MKNRIINLILVFFLVVGLGLVLYPYFSDYWNSFHQSQVIAHYAEDIANLDEDRYLKLLEVAREWNRKLANHEIIERMKLNEQEEAEYNAVLDPSGTGMIGYIEIPSIDCFLGIYHGTSEAVLQIAVGHLEWSSLPVGGESTHSVISGHRGLPSAKLFTNLDKLRVGDEFDIYVLGETYRYSVDQIKIVEPQDLSLLQVVENEDYCTLVTCTPYAINTHRLLVRGTRVENVTENALHFTSEAMQIDTVLVAAVLAVPIILFLILIVFIGGGRSEAREREKIKREAMKRILAHQAAMDLDESSEKAQTAKKTQGKKAGKQKKSESDEFEFLE